MLTAYCSLIPSFVLLLFSLADRSNYVRPYSQQVMTLLVPSDKAMPQYYNYKKTQWPKLTQFLMVTGKVSVDRFSNIKQDHTVPSSEGCPIYKLSATGDKKIVLSGDKHDSPTAKIIAAKLYESDTVLAHGVDGLMEPCNL